MVLEGKSLTYYFSTDSLLNHNHGKLCRKSHKNLHILTPKWRAKWTCEMYKFNIHSNLWTSHRNAVCVHFRTVALPSNTQNPSEIVFCGKLFWRTGELPNEGHTHVAVTLSGSMPRNRPANVRIPQKNWILSHMNLCDYALNIDFGPSWICQLCQLCCEN